MASQQKDQPVDNGQAVAKVEARQAAEQSAVARRGISDAQWRTLCNNLFPGAHPNSVLMVWDYCTARKLDPLKKPCHIVPMRVKNALTGTYETRDVVMPGIYEYRTTAQRTGQYLGHSKPDYGPVVDYKGLPVPEWCAITAFRWNAEAKQSVPFPVQVFFREVVAEKDGRPNDRWSKAPIQMLTKCTEAAALREAFPDELGGEATAEEMDGQRPHDAAPVIETKALPEKPENFEEWLSDLYAVADEGEAKFADAWAKAPPACRQYLAAATPEAIESMKARAAQAVPA